MSKVSHSVLSRSLVSSNRHIGIFIAVGVSQGENEVAAAAHAVAKGVDMRRQRLAVIPFRLSKVRKALK